DMKARVHHLQSEVSLAHVAERAHALADGKRFLVAGIEMEETQDQLCVSVLEQAYELASRSILDVGIGDGGFDLPRLSVLERGQGTQMRVVLVAQREVQYEVLLARDTEPHELVGARIARLGLSRGSFFSCHEQQHPATRCAAPSKAQSPGYDRTSTASTSIRAPLGSAATW